MLPCTEERSAIIKATTWNTKCAWKLKPVWHSGFGKRHIDHSDFKISLHTHNDGDPYRTGTSCPAWCGLSALGLPPLTPWDISYFCRVDFVVSVIEFYIFSWLLSKFMFTTLWRHGRGGSQVQETQGASYRSCLEIISYNWLHRRFSHVSFDQLTNRCLKIIWSHL